MSAKKKQSVSGSGGKGDAAEKLGLISASWLERWPRALEIWSPYVRLRPPLFCLSREDEKREGLNGTFAMIRLTDFSVVLSLVQINAFGLEDFALEIMAHEIGHHVYCPADLADQGRMIARVQKTLPRVEHQTGYVVNLYSDLLINDRLVREHGLRMDKVYLAVKQKVPDELWNFYMRACEILWSLPRQTLTSIPVTEEMESDAQLANRIARNFSRDWLRGASAFAALCYPYLLKQYALSPQLWVWMDSLSPGNSADIPPGLVEIDEDEANGPLVPSEDKITAIEKVPEKSKKGENRKNFREPFEYGQILKAIGINLEDRELAVRYYRERAIPFLVPFPSVEKPESADPQPEELTPWDVGSSADKIDWFESVLRGPVVIPGYTTVERVYGKTQGGEPEREPVDLDLYVDCSGSMPDPAYNVSYLTLAAAIISISALRTGSRVQATLWSGTNDFLTTGGFISDELEIMKIMTGYIGGATAFPIHILRKTYDGRDPRARKVHILVISDDGVTTMFDKDEQGNSGGKIAVMALEKAGGGGTFALNLYDGWEKNAGLKKAQKMGWDIYAITSWEGLLDFSREFVRKHYPPSPPLIRGGKEGV